MAGNKRDQTFCTQCQITGTCFQCGTKQVPVWDGNKTMPSEESKRIERLKDRSQSPSHKERRRNKSKYNSKSKSHVVSAPSTANTTNITTNITTNTSNITSNTPNNNTSPTKSSSLHRHRRTTNSINQSPSRRRTSRSRSIDRISKINLTPSPRRQERINDGSSSSNSESDNGDDNDAESDANEAEQLRTPGNDRTSRRLDKTIRTSSATTLEQSSYRGLRRRIKYQPSKSKTKSNNTASQKELSTPQSVQHSDDGFQVTTTSGNISTWEMRQRFLREFPNEPLPSDIILRQLYRGHKIVDYERIERYKLEYPGEPVPSDEVLKKLYEVRPADQLPKAADEPSVSSSVDTEIMAMARPIQRQELLNRQNSESNMTFISEVGWGGFGKLPQTLSGIAMPALEETEDTESFNDSSHFPPSKSPPARYPLESPMAPMEQWVHSFHDMTSLHESKPGTVKTADGIDSEFLNQSAVIVRRPSDASLKEEKTKNISTINRTKKKSSSQRKARKNDPSKVFHESFDSIGYFLDNKSKPKINSTSKLKTAQNEKKTSSKQKSKKSKSVNKKKEDNKRSICSGREHEIASQSERFKALAPSADQSKVSSNAKENVWWDLSKVDKSPSGRVSRVAGPQSPIRSIKEEDAWRKREAWKRETWKKQPRTRSAPLSPIKMLSSEDGLVHSLFNGDPFALGKTEVVFDHEFDTFGDPSNGASMRCPPTRSRSSDCFPASTTSEFDAFGDNAKQRHLQSRSSDLGQALPESPLETGLLRPSKRDIRRGKSIDRQSRTHNGLDNTIEARGMNISAMLTHSGNDDDNYSQEEGVELCVDRNDEPMSPITVATKKPISRSLIARRRF